MQRAKAFFFVCAGVFLLALAYHFGASSATAQAAGTSAVGRWVIVNGMPTLARTIMLLDTATGTTWVACEGAEDGATKWCRVPRSEATSGANTDK